MILSMPLKNQLQAARGASDAVCDSAPFIYGLLFAVLACAAYLELARAIPQSKAPAAATAAAAPPSPQLWVSGAWRSSLYLRCPLEAAVTLTLASAGALVMPTRERRGALGWLLLVWIYATRVLVPEPWPGCEFHLGELYVWAVLVQRAPLAGQAQLGTFMARWWPVWGLACGLLLPPGRWGRMDRSPSAHLGLRARHYLVEAIAVLAFTTIPSAGAQHAPPIPEALRCHLPWLSRWSLFAFCTHWAIYHLIPGAPGGLLVVCATAIPFRPAFELQQQHLKKKEQLHRLPPLPSQPQQQQQQQGTSGGAAMTEIS